MIELAAQQRRGVPVGSQSVSDPDTPLFALRAGMNENTKTMGEPTERKVTAPERQSSLGIQGKPTFRILRDIPLNNG